MGEATDQKESWEIATILMITVSNLGFFCGKLDCGLLVTLPSKMGAVSYSKASR